MSGINKNKVLFITWDGPEVTYIENLFAPIFEMLQKKFLYEIHIMQFTSADSTKIEARKINVEKMGLRYLGIQTSKKYTLFSLLKAKFFDKNLIEKYLDRNNIGVIMPRALNSYFIVNSILKRDKYKFVWDADGFPLEERVEFAGLSINSFRYKFLKKNELEGYKAALSIICRTLKAKAIISEMGGKDFNKNKIFVVSNGTFVPEKFTSSVERSEQLTIVYSGSLGDQYLFPEMIQMFKWIKKTIPNALFKILTFNVDFAKNYVESNEPDLISSIEIKTVAAEDVYNELRSAHIGISFRKPSISMQGVAPIKIVEYLTAGLSIIYNPRVGDLDNILGGNSFTYSWDLKTCPDTKSLDQWIHHQIKIDHSDEIKKLANRYFSMDQTVNMYHHALQYEE